MDNNKSNSCTVPLTKPDLNDLQLYEHEDPYSKRDRVRWKGNIALTIVSIVACVCTCVCAVYCGFVLNEVKAIQNRISAHAASNVPVTETISVPAKQTSDVNFIRTSEGDIVLDGSGDKIDADIDEIQTANEGLDIDSDYQFEESDDEDDTDEDEDEDVTSETDLDDESDEESEYIDETDDVDENELANIDQSGESSESESQTDGLDVQSSGDGYLEKFDDEDIVRKRREAPTPTTKRPGRKGRRKGKKNKNKGKKNKGQKQRKQRKKKLTFLPAAQFDGSVSDEVVRSRLGNKEFNTYENIRGTPLHIFKPVSWVNDSTSPVTFDGKATFTAKYSGVHLVQAQLLFGGYTRRRSASILQIRAGTTVSFLTCSMGVHFAHSSNGSGNQQNTCSIIGMMALQENDKIQVVTNNREAQLEAVEGSTHFGIVQLNRS